MHKHHVTPTYRDTNSAITVDVTVTQHAMYHWCNWQLWGDKRDWLAWKGLCGEIPKEEIVRELRRLGGIKASTRTNRQRTEKMLAHTRALQPKAVEAAKLPESRKKRKKTLALIAHQQGIKNSQFGTMWITNGSVNCKIPKDGDIPEGYRKGRVMGMR